MRKGDLEEGKVYKVNHQDFGEFIGKFIRKRENGELSFIVIYGGIDFRLKIDMRPGLARYYEYKPTSVEF
jgi:hypothetical protein